MAEGLTEEQKADIDEAFKLHSKGKPRLDLQGLGAFMRYMGLNLSNADLSQMGSMDLNQVYAYFGQKMAVEDTEHDVIQAFEVFDRDGAGLISTVELRHVLTGMGDRLDPKQVEEMIASADQGDGMVDFRRLVTTMVQNQKRY